MSFCQITLEGHLGRDPEMRYTPAGQAVTEFSVAVNQGKRDKDTGEWSDETDWFRCTVWGNRAEYAAESLRKGNRVLLTGRFKSREWQTRDGEDRTSLEVTVDQVVNLTPREEREGSFSAAPARASRAPSTRPVDDDLDDLPF